MEGTGILYDPLLKLIPESIENEVIPLSQFQSKEPALQAIELAKTIGNEETVIFTESYSGLIAYELCKLESPSIIHVFFAAGFLERPSLISKFSQILPLTFLRWKLIPRGLLSFLFFGESSKKELVDLFYRSLSQVTNKTLRTRLNIIAKAKRPKERINQPVTYISASNDWLVSESSIEVFEELCSNLNIVNLEGGHFIVQSNPEKCWEQILNVIAL